MVPGRIFEKKTAMWVYHMIRDFTRKDPGILVYKSPDKIDFRVYPFLRNELREASLTLLYPKDTHPVITVADRELMLGQEIPATEQKAFINDPSSAYNFSFLSADKIAALPALKREPYLHFILDYSLSGYASPEAYARQIDLTLKHFPDIKQLRMTAAHFNIQSLGAQAFSVTDKAQRDQALQAYPLEQMGALDLNRVLKKLLLDYEQGWTTLADAPGPQHWNTYPVFVVLSKRPQDVLFVHDNLAYYDYLLPEQNYFYFLQSGAELKRVNLWRQQPLREQAEVVALRRGTHVMVIPHKSDQPQLAFHLDRDKDQEGSALDVFDPQQNYFVAVSGIEKIPSGRAYVRGLEAVLESYRSIQRPKQVKQPQQILEESRKLNILTPLTSFIVVERDSQWKTLELKEKQKMRAHQAFDFEEDFDTPTPSFVHLVLILLGCHFFFKIVLRKSNTV
jgi:hypothetical protein